MLVDSSWRRLILTLLRHHLVMRNVTVPSCSGRVEVRGLSTPRPIRTLCHSFLTILSLFRPASREFSILSASVPGGVVAIRRRWPCPIWEEAVLRRSGDGSPRLPLAGLIVARGLSVWGRLEVSRPPSASGRSESPVHPVIARHRNPLACEPVFLDPDYVTNTIAVFESRSRLHYASHTLSLKTARTVFFDFLPSDLPILCLAVIFSEKSSALNLAINLSALSVVNSPWRLYGFCRVYFQKHI